MGGLVAEGITITPDVMSGSPCIAGTSIQPRTISSFAKAGYSVSPIMREYPGLTVEQIAHALAWQARTVSDRQAAIRATALPPSPEGG